MLAAAFVPFRPLTSPLSTFMRFLPAFVRSLPTALAAGPAAMRSLPTASAAGPAFVRSLPTALTAGMFLRGCRCGKWMPVRIAYLSASDCRHEKYPGKPEKGND